jgi:hypothetical protein
VSSWLISQNVRMKIYKTIMLSVLFIACETWSRAFREHKLGVLKNRVVWRTFRQESGETFIMRSSVIWTRHWIFTRMINLKKRMRWTGHGGNEKCVKKNLVRKREMKRLLRKPWRVQVDNIKMDLREVWLESVDSIQLTLRIRTRDGILSSR